MNWKKLGRAALQVLVVFAIGIPLAWLVTRPLNWALDGLVWLGLRPQTALGAITITLVLCAFAFFTLLAYGEEPDPTPAPAPDPWWTAGWWSVAEQYPVGREFTYRGVPMIVESYGSNDDGTPDMVCAYADSTGRLEEWHFSVGSIDLLLGRGHE